MISQKNFRKLDTFLKANKCKDGLPHTHTRIGNRNMKIYGGSYIIEDSETFRKLYHQHVFLNKKDEYLTERQNISSGGPILVDLDFRYSNEIKIRQHKSDLIHDIIYLYSEKLRNLLDFSVIESDEIEVPFYIFQKPKVNVLEDKTKDGIHMLIGIRLKHDVQQVLRLHVLKDMQDILFNKYELPLINTVNDVVDECISTGKTNWQLYGSKKPGHDAYKLKYVFNTIFYKDSTESEIIQDDNNGKDIDNIDKIKIFSTNYDGWVSLTAKPEFEKQVSCFKPVVKKKKPAVKIDASANVLGIYPNVDSNNFDQNNFSGITDENILDAHIQQHLSAHPTVADHYRYLMILPEKYYTEYNLWKKVGWILKNTATKITEVVYFKLYIKFSCKSKDKFNWEDIPNMWKEWCKSHDDGDLSIKTIYYWANRDNKKEYDKIKLETCDSLIERTLVDETDWDIANLAVHLFGNTNICIDVVKNTWYSFKKHRWTISPAGSDIRIAISNKLAYIYLQKEKEVMAKLNNCADLTQEEQSKLMKKVVQYNSLGKKMRMTSDKNKFIYESRVLTYNRAGKTLLNKLDTNPYIIGFENGVYDFNEGRFRDGMPEDFVSLSTRRSYVEIDYENIEHQQIIKQINTFFEQLFPDPELRRYVWQHAASGLIGSNQNQTFNIYTGVGANGKSLFVEFMAMALGDYRGTVPISLITQKRATVGGTSSEVAQLKGKRYAVMNEPSEGDKINEGILKEITGGDQITGRDLYLPAVTFTPAFDLVACTNHLFDITAQDDGTWRRIRVVPFVSTFADPKDIDKMKKERQHVFLKDKEMKNKIEKWIPIFLSMLIEIAKETKGKVDDCDAVLKESNAYRQQQDFIAAFIDEKIVKGNSNDSVIKTEIQVEFKQWYESEYNKKAPSNKKLAAYLKKKYGNPKKINGRLGWRGIKIAYAYESDDEDD